MICAWIDTSSAVVGSSATMSCGSAASASAITTLAHAAGELVRVLVEADGAPGCRCRRAARWRARAPVSPTAAGGADRLHQLAADRVSSGFSEVSGSWKIAPMRRPRSARICSCGRLSMRRPASRISPPAMRPWRFEQADDGRAGERLAGARLADHAQHLARRDVEGDAVQRHQRAAARRETRRAGSHFKQRAVLTAASGSARRAASRPAG